MKHDAHARESAGQAHSPSAPGDEEQLSSIPGFRTWRSMYIWVLIFFALYVVVLVALERAFA